MHKIAARISPFFLITRPHNCSGAALATFLGGYLVSGEPVDWFTPSLLYAGAAVWLIVAACNVVNDLQDELTDDLNKPYRPLPAGKITRQEASLFIIGLFLVAWIISWRLGPVSLGIALCASLLGSLYSYYLKSTVLVGNGMVGLLSGITVIFGSTSMGKINLATALASLLIFMFVFTREILKTIADQDCDTLKGIHTVATTLGKERAFIIFQIFTLIFILVTLAPWLLHVAPYSYLYSVVSMMVLPTLGVQFLLTLRFSDATVLWSLRLTKLLWFFGLYAMMFLK